MSEFQKIAKGLGAAGEQLRLGFYAFFAPVSYSADENPDSAGFTIHRGFEAALLSALEALDGTGLSFSRHPITTWSNIWLHGGTERRLSTLGDVSSCDVAERPERPSWRP